MKEYEITLYGGYVGLQTVANVTLDEKGIYRLINNIGKDIVFTFNSYQSVNLRFYSNVTIKEVQK